MKFRPSLLVADGLSLLRILSLVPLFMFSLSGQWTAAFFTLLIGWGTDLADGAAARAAARRSGSSGSVSARKGIDMDGIADSFLAFAASGIAATYLIAHSTWAVAIIIGVLYGLTVVSGGAMVAVMNKPLTSGRRWLIAGNMIVMHGMIQIGATLLWFAYKAGGIDDLIAMLVVLVSLAFLQLPKMKLWWAGRFQ